MTKNIFRIIILSLVAITLFSCATRQKYIDQQKAWIGQSVDSYIKEFGYPDNIIDVSPLLKLEVISIVVGLAKAILSQTYKREKFLLL